jgi:Rab-GTPase-TBC domain
MNTVRRTRSLLEDVKESEHYSKLPFEDQEFWEIYYRHNNYFLEKNSSLLAKIKNNRNFVQASVLNNNTIGFEEFIEFFDPETHNLSHIGVRVCSLMDIIRIQVSLGLQMSLINPSVKNISQKFKVSNEVIERVFRATEDEISLLTCTDSLKPQTTRIEVFTKVFEYLTAKEATKLVSCSKHLYTALRENLIAYHLKHNDLIDRETRLKLWLALMPRNIKTKKFRTLEEARVEDKKFPEPFEEIIDMDLKRSLDFFDKADYDNMKLILLNVALENHETIGYYQGMNYIAIFLQQTFKDPVVAYRFFCYLTHTLLAEHFSSSFGGLVKLIWISDKVIQINSPSLWNKLRNGGVSSIHFAVPNLITLFASLVKSKDAVPFIFEIWDTMFFEGLFAVLKTLISVLEIQKSHIDEIDSDELLSSMKDIESDPFAIIRKSSAGQEVIQGYMQHLNRKNLRNIRYDVRVYNRLNIFYSEVVSQIQAYWN